jgi:hypothetical protein
MEVGWTTGGSANDGGFWLLYTMIKKTTELFVLASTGMLNLYRKQSTKCETVAKIQDKQVATVCTIDMYNVIRIFWFPKSVANCNRWPTSQVLLITVNGSEHLHTSAL